MCHCLASTSKRTRAATPARECPHPLIPKIPMHAHRHTHTHAHHMRTHPTCVPQAPGEDLLPAWPAARNLRERTPARPRPLDPRKTPRIGPRQKYGLGKKADLIRPAKEPAPPVVRPVPLTPQQVSCWLGPTWEGREGWQGWQAGVGGKGGQGKGGCAGMISRRGCI